VSQASSLSEKIIRRPHGRGAMKNDQQRINSSADRYSLYVDLRTSSGSKVRQLEPNSPRRR